MLSSLLNTFVIDESAKFDLNTCRQSGICFIGSHMVISIVKFTCCS